MSVDKGFKKGTEGEEEPGGRELKFLALEVRAEEIVACLVKEALRDRLGAEKLFQVTKKMINNAEWIRNIPEVEGYGSGPVEKTVDLTFSRRFKKREKSWLRPGVNSLVELGGLKLNGEGDA